MPSTLAISYIINLLKLWFHLISKINIIQSVHIPILHPLHPKSLIIDVYCRTSELMTSKLNLLIVLATILHSKIVPLATSLRGIWASWTMTVMNVFQASTEFRVMGFNASFNNISVTSWWSVLLVVNTRIPGKNHRPVGNH